MTNVRFNEKIGEFEIVHASGRCRSIGRKIKVIFNGVYPQRASVSGQWSHVYAWDVEIVDVGNAMLWALSRNIYAVLTDIIEPGELQELRAFEYEVRGRTHFSLIAKGVDSGINNCR